MANTAARRAKVWRLSQNNPDKNEAAAALAKFKRMCKDAGVSDAPPSQEPIPGRVNSEDQRQSYYDPRTQSTYDPTTNSWESDRARPRHPKPGD